MARSAPQTDTRLAPSISDDNYIHIVGDIQYWLDRLGLKVPRALCGVLLVADPDRADPMHLGAPNCSNCERLNR
jgi:hypothetical protein